MRMVRDFLKDLLQVLSVRRFIWKIRNNQNIICLTFDDGPHPDRTIDVLDTLKQKNIKATFFVVGEKAKKYPKIIKRMIAEGHTIGIHGLTHTDFKNETIDFLISELEKTRNILAEIGVDTNLFRPPKGSLRIRQLFWVLIKGYSVVLWTRSAKDYLSADPNEVLGRATYPDFKGILLLHDTVPNTVVALPSILEVFENKGYLFVNLPLRYGVTK